MTTEINNERIPRGEGPTGIKLLPVHLDDLRKSGLTNETILEAGIYSETDYRKIAGMLDRKRWDRKLGDVLVFPYFDPEGAVTMRRVKPSSPPTRNGKTIGKYLSPNGAKNRAYIPKRVRATIDDPKAPIVITEGEKKALAATQFGFPCIGLAGVENWHDKQNSLLVLDLERIPWKDRPVYLAFDSDSEDKPQVETAQQLLARTLEHHHGAKVRIVRIPHGPDGAKMGVDDYLVAYGPSALNTLLNKAEEPTGVLNDTDLKLNAKDIYPEVQARLFIEKNSVAGFPCLRFWRETWWWYNEGQFTPIDDKTVKAELVRFINRTHYKVRDRVICDIMAQVQAQTILPYRDDPPFILDKKSLCAVWNVRELLFTRDAIIHLPSFIQGEAVYSVKPSPAIFTTTAIPVSFDPAPAEPKEWIGFLRSIWSDDPEAIEALQLWLGYLLVADTSQQKAVMLIGPKRAGKGVLCNVMRRLVGDANHASPTLHGLTERFGLAPLLGKSLAVIPDARLGSRTDATVVTERLLSIIGEDELDIDQKYRNPVTCKLGTRIVLATNELPYLRDASGALVGRFIILHLTKSFYGQEDTALNEKLRHELPGILLWAIDGWRKLQERRRLLQPASGERKAEEQTEFSSPVQVFVDVRCDIGPEYRIERTRLYNEYTTWSENEGCQFFDPATFGRELRTVVPTVKDTRASLGGHRTRLYCGIDIKAPD